MMTCGAIGLGKRIVLKMEAELRDAGLITVDPMAYMTHSKEFKEGREQYMAKQCKPKTGGGKKK